MSSEERQWTDRGRPQKFSVDSVAVDIYNKNEPMSVQEIADSQDVTRQTVHKYMDELKGHPEIEFKDIGGSFIFWAKSGFGHRKQRDGRIMTDREKKALELVDELDQLEFVDIEGYLGDTD